ncbi:hypothetical protein EPUS_07266 [Endocarpon pusillum Z07020]|uniref:Uncharacterized protein n=1 Tax=Endocarpon pusillum (strain Z07020 / HMAS-L-300199) TaxID=1263415 RepID=U1HIQ7_ENDPU|nr:uncharacterized protein EPUS_07266 [Endocarpon pusillum Z07020]ERF68779.1 hypothetical protein EPUS_07266 [Endocarpon pusillum Z07020]
MRAAVEQDVIRDNDGNLESRSLTFQLRDFANNLATTFPDANLNEVITLHYGDLANYLARAEKFQAQKQRPNLDNMGILEPSPPAEELTAEDEKKFHDLENQSSARSEALDPDH